MIQVRSGRHAGAEIALDAGTYLLGAGSSADIVLTDDGIAPGHVELRFEGEFCRFWSLDGTIRTPGRLLASGGRGEAKLPADVTVGGVDLTLLAPMLPRTTRAPWRRHVVVGIGGLVVVVGGGIGTVLSGSVPAFSTPALVSAVIPDSVPSVTPAPVMAKAENNTPRDGGAAGAADALTERLGPAGLVGRITVRATGAVVEASGTLAPGQRDSWLRLQMWFDETYKGRFPLVHLVKVEADAASPQLAIQAIWAGSGPYVIGADGEKYGQGAVLPGGWRVEEIALDQVVVSRGGERVSLIP